MVGIVAIVLAAGESKRMGSPKMLLDFGGKTMIERVIDNVICPEIENVIVVLGAYSEEIKKKLDLPLQTLELSVRASNCLEMAKIETVGQLARMQENELLALRSFGKTSLREVKRKLADIGLTIGYGS